jgi:glyceraldehyde-3-phosphate dehydrogenase (NADP+)
MTAIKLGELLAEAGCPKGQVNVIVTPNELAERAAHDPRVRHITFTGSSAIGWKLKQNIPADKRVTLELGGNAPLIIHDDADLNAAIPIAASGAFGYAGQSCISVQRILVQQSIYPTFRDRFLQHIREKIKTGDPRDRSVIVGPMIDADALKRVRSAIDDALRGGAKVLCGNEVIGPCLTPTVIENADPKCPLVAAEVFAPVATLHRYNTFDEALAMANDSVYGLQAGVFTREISKAWHAFESLEFGGVTINQAPTWRVETMPYGGVKQSGFGREGIKYAMQEMTEPRVIVMKIE